MRFLAFLFFLLFAAFALGARWYFVCEVQQLCESKAARADRPTTLELIEGDSTILEGYQQFLFEEGQVNPSLNTNNDQFLNKVFEFFEGNPAKNLTVTSFYRTSEEDMSSGIFENLGIARAASIRDLLVKKGMDEDRISIDYGISEDPSLGEPILFESYLPSEIPTAFEKIQFTFTNMTFSDANFSIGSDEFVPDSPFILYADSVKKYLESNPNSKLIIIGHTDDSGTDQYNLDLGLRRAESAKEYFSELGVTNGVSTESKGEEQPVAPNNNNENRQKNRRVNFRLE